MYVLGRYSPEQLFAVVAGVDMYQDFVPWCQRSKVLWRKGSKLDAELEIGFKFLVERYISHVHLSPPNLIKVSVPSFPQFILSQMVSMIRENRQLVTDEPVEFEK